MSLQHAPSTPTETICPSNQHLQRLAPPINSPNTVRSGQCIECPTKITIHGRGKLALRCKTCRREHRKLSNRLSQRRFKAKERAARMAKREAQAGTHAGRMTQSHARTRPKGIAATTKRRSTAEKTPGSAAQASRPQSRARQIRKRLHGHIGNGIIVRSEWAERIDGIDELFAALAAAQLRAENARRALDAAYG